MWRGWLLLPILLPVLGGIGVLGIHTLRVRRRTVSLLLAVQLLVVAAVFRMEGEPFVFLTLTEGVRFVLRPDALGRLFAELICAVWFAVAFFAFEYMNHEGHRERFFGFYLLTLGALMGVCLAGNLVTLYLFYEMMTLLSVPLVLHIGTRKAFDAAYRYLGFSVTGAGLGLLGLFLLQGFCTTDLFTPGGVLDPARAAQDRGLLLAVFFVMAVGFGCKAGMFPLHAWLPIAHPVAPAPASAVLSGLITKMGVLALIRVAYYLFGWPFLDGSWAQRAVLVLALITIFLGSTLAMREDTLKKRLAYWGVGVLMVSALLTAGYLLPIVTAAFFPGEKFDHRAVMRQQDTWLMWITLCALTAAVVVLGMFPGLLEPAVQAVTGPLFGGAA